MSSGFSAIARVNAAIACSPMFRRKQALPRFLCATGIRLQRERLFAGGARLVIALEIEQRKAEIGMGVRRARIERDGALENPAGRPRTARFRGWTRRADAWRQRNWVRPSAHAGKATAPRHAGPAVGGERSQQGLRLLQELLLQLRVLEGAGAGGALQGMFSRRISAENLAHGRRDRHRTARGHAAFRTAPSRPCRAP